MALSVVGIGRTLVRIVVALAVGVAALSGLAANAASESGGLNTEEAEIVAEIAALIRGAEAHPSRADEIRQILFEEYAPKLRDLLAQQEEAGPSATSGSQLGGGSAQVAMAATQAAYTYDSRNRLRMVLFTDGNGIEYEYDDAGNRETVLVPEPNSIASITVGGVALFALARCRRKGAVRRAAHLALGVVLMNAGGSVHAAGSLPGIRSPELPPVSLLFPNSAASGPGAQASAASTPAAATQASSSAEITPEIVELARALRHDVDLIYEFVYNQIEYNPVWGSEKGAMGALLDRAGNEFDQASLMIALLRASNYEASFVRGQLDIPAAELLNWWGTSNDPYVVAAYVLSTGRTPSNGTSIETSDGTPDGTLLGALVERVWVKVAIDGTDYVFDPAFKSYTYTSGIDVGVAMGYNAAGFPGSGVDSSLQAYAATLAAEIETNHSGDSIRDIVGGRSINPLTGTLRQTSLPFQTQEFEEWADIPSTHRATLRVTLPGIDETFNTDSLSGKRVTIFYASNQPVLRLDGITIDSGTAVAPGTVQSLSLEVDHPHLFNTDDAGALSIVAGDSYLVLHDATGTREGRVRYHAEREQENTFNGGGVLSEPILGESLAVLAASWLAQLDAVCQLATQLSNAHCFSYHHVGVVGQQDSPVVDVPMQVASVVSNVNSATDLRRGVFSTISAASSALEGGAIEQVQAGMRGVSTVALFGLASDQATTFFEATSANFGSLPLQNYDPSTIGDIQGELSGGGRVVLPQNGALSIDDWSGAAYLIIEDAPEGRRMGYFIDGAMKGGAGSTPGDLNVDEPFEPDSRCNRQAADPVDLVTGDFLHQSTDLTVGSQPYPFSLEFTKSYNSGARYLDGPLGLGWTHSFDLWATSSSDGFQAFGRDSPLDAVGVIVATHVSVDVLTRGDSAGDHVLAALVERWFISQLVDNIVTVAEPDSSAVFVRLPDGSYSSPPGSASTLSVQPDQSYRLTTKHGATADYNINGQIESWRDRNGNTVSFLYTNDRLQSVTDAASHTLTFGYNGNRISSVTDGQRTYLYAYDGADLETVTDANNEVTTFVYPSEGLLTEMFTPAHPTDPQFVNTYNVLGHVEAQRYLSDETWTFYIGGNRSEHVDPRSYSEVAYYNDCGRVLRVIDRAGNPPTLFEYDGERRLVRRTEPEQNYTEYEYDERHNLKKITRFPKPGSTLDPIVSELTYDPVFNQIETFKNPREFTTTYHYFPNGDLKRIEQPPVPEGVPNTWFEYNGRGQVRLITDPEDRVTALSYDALTADLLTSIQDPGSAPEVLNLVTTLTYNSAGDITSVQDPRMNTVTIRPDDMRRIEEIESPAPFGYLTRFRYDEDGEIEEVARQTDNPFSWQRTEATYTRFGQLKTFREPTQNAPLWQYAYDDRGQMWRVSDALGLEKELLYDERGSLKRVVDVSSGSTLQEYTYWPNGQLKSVTDGNGNITGYRYDGFDRLEFIDHDDNTFEQFEYDPASNLTIQTTRAGDTIAYTYDALDRVRSKTPLGSPQVTFKYDLSGLLKEVGESGGASFYTYDSAGRRETFTDQNGRGLAYEYDGAGNRSKLTYPDGSFVTFEYDQMNRLKFVRDQGVTILGSFGYDALSRRDWASYGNGTSTDYVYELDNDLELVSHQFVGGVAPSFSYTYDALHNRKTGGASDALYVYDLLQIPPATYAPANELNQYTTVVEGGVPHSPVYDDNGNLETPRSTLSLTFDVESRLASATTPTDTLNFDYDAFGVRRQKTVNGVATDYVLDGLQVVAEYGAAGTLLRRYVYAGLDQPIQLETGGVAYFYHHDGLGSVVALTDAGGLLAESYAYSPYGRVGSTSGPAIANPYLFAGREFDAEIGLYYNRFRYYDPGMGRFVSPDPIGQSGGVNLYSYALNDPANAIDPLGLISGELIATVVPGVVIRVRGGRDNASGKFFGSIGFGPGTAGGFSIDLNGAPPGAGCGPLDGNLQAGLSLRGEVGAGGGPFGIGTAFENGFHFGSSMFEPLETFESDERRFPFDPTADSFPLDPAKIEGRVTGFVSVNFNISFARTEQEQRLSGESSCDCN